MFVGKGVEAENMMVYTHRHLKRELRKKLLCLLQTY